MQPHMSQCTHKPTTHTHTGTHVSHKQLRAAHPASCGDAVRAGPEGTGRVVGREKVGVQSGVCERPSAAGGGPTGPLTPGGAEGERRLGQSGRQHSDGLPSDPPHLNHPSRLPKSFLYPGSSHPCLLS